MSNDQSIFMYLQCPYSEKFYKKESADRVECQLKE